MKKILTVAMAVVMLGVGASAALAAGQGCGRGLSGVHHNGLCNQLHANCAYTDANGDGVCDNCGTGAQRKTAIMTARAITEAVTSKNGV